VGSLCKANDESIPGNGFDDDVGRSFLSFGALRLCQYSFSFDSFSPSPPWFGKGKRKTQTRKEKQGKYVNRKRTGTGAGFSFPPFHHAEVSLFLCSALGGRRKRCQLPNNGPSQPWYIFYVFPCSGVKIGKGAGEHVED